MKSAAYSKTLCTGATVNVIFVSILLLTITEGTVELVSGETLSWERSNGHVYFIAEPRLLSEVPATCKRKAFRSYPVILESSEEWTDTKDFMDLNPAAFQFWLGGTTNTAPVCTFSYDSSYIANDTGQNNVVLLKPLNGDSSLWSADITLADSLGVRYQTICELEQERRLNRTGALYEEILLDSNLTSCLPKSSPDKVYKFHGFRRWAIFYHFTVNVTFNTSVAVCDGAGYLFVYQDEGNMNRGCNLGRECEIMDKANASGQLKCSLKCPCQTLHCNLLLGQTMTKDVKICEVSISL